MSTASSSDPSAAPSVSLPQAIAFVDGQNLFYQAKRAFGYEYPNYNVLQLAQAVCHEQRWRLKQARFYTGVPGPGDDPFWNHFWSRKLRVMSQHGVVVHSRSVRYRAERIELPDGSYVTHRFAEEKGVDVRIAVDALRGAFQGDYDVAIIFSLDQDLAEAAREIREVAQAQCRTITVASAYPVSGRTGRPNPISATLGLPIERAMYDLCIDPRDYRPAARSR